MRATDQPVPDSMPDERLRELGVHPGVLVVVPAFNERPAIGTVVGELAAAGWRVVVVDDGSSDGTGASARAAGATVLAHRINLGQGAAILTGLTYCLRKGAEIIVTFDADGQHQALDVWAVVEPILEGRADAVLGSRFLGSSPGIPVTRKVLLRAGVWATRFATGLRLTDTHNGLRAVSAGLAGRLRLTQPRMAHASEWLEELARVRARVVEVPVDVRYTQYSLRKGQRTRHALGTFLDYLLG